MAATAGKSSRGPRNTTGFRDRSFNRRYDLPAEWHTLSSLEFKALLGKYPQPLHEVLRKERLKRRNRGNVKKMRQKGSDAAAAIGCSVVSNLASRNTPLPTPLARDEKFDARYGLPAGWWFHWTKDELNGFTSHLKRGEIGEIFKIRRLRRQRRAQKIYREGLKRAGNALQRVGAADLKELVADDSLSTADSSSSGYCSLDDFADWGDQLSDSLPEFSLAAALAAQTDLLAAETDSLAADLLAAETDSLFADSLFADSPFAGSSPADSPFTVVDSALGSDEWLTYIKEMQDMPFTAASTEVPPEVELPSLAMELEDFDLAIFSP